MATSKIIPRRSKIIPILAQPKNGKAEESIVSPELSYLSNNYKYIIPSNLIFQITENNKILIKVQFEEGKKNDAISEFKIDFPSLFSSIPPLPIISESDTFMDLFLPINQLNKLNDDKYNDLLKNVKPLYPPITNSGVVRSKGDIIQKSSIVRESFRLNHHNECLPIDGSGVKIGVISDSYDTQKYTIFSNPDNRITQNKTKAKIDVLNGDLPGKGNPNGYKTEVQVIQENRFQATDEGRAMLQIVHDVAPGAELFFHSASTLEEFKKAIERLEEQGCSIIVDDLTFIEESFFDTESDISKAIEKFTNKEKNRNFFFSAAGNFGNYGYQGIFESEENRGNTDFITSGENKPDTVFRTNRDNVVLFQKVKFTKAGTYMIVLQWDESEFEQGKSSDLDIYLVDDNGNLLIGNNRFNPDGDTMEYLVFIVKEKTSANILITSAKGYPSKKLPFRYIVFRHNNGFSYDNMEEEETPTVSGHAMKTDRGHAMTTDVITVGAVGENNCNKLKIRNYSSFGRIEDNNKKKKNDIDFVAPDGENINVALIGQDTNDDHFPNFFGTSASAPHAAGAFALMISAIKYCESDKLQKIDIDVLQLFKDNCKDLESPENTGSGLINTEKAFLQLLVDKPILKNSIVNNDENPCEEINDKPVLQIIAHDIICEYGQSWKLTYSIEGIPDGETIDDLNLPNIKLKTTAVKPYPDVNNYRITPYFEEELAENLNALYKINFIPGVLSISKKDLVIRAKDNSFIKNRPINIEFVYQYNTNGIEDNDLFLATIKQEHLSTFCLNEKMTVLINNFEDNALDRGDIIKDDDVLYWLLETGSWMTLISEENMGRINLNQLNGNSIYEIEFNLFKEYLNFLKLEGDFSRFRPLSNNYRPLANNYRPLANNYRPLANNYRPLANNYQPLANNYRPLANNYRPLANTSSNNNGHDPVENQMHLILNEDFLQSTKEIQDYEYYSINLITGLNSDEVHYVFPGAFFAHMSINFNITYGSGRFLISKMNKK